MQQSGKAPLASLAEMRTRLFEVRLAAEKLGAGMAVYFVDLALAELGDIERGEPTGSEHMRLP